MTDDLIKRPPQAPVLAQADADKLRDLWGAAKAKSTIRAYRSDWADWEGWCAEAGAPALPAHPVEVALYVVTLVERGLKLATIERRLAAIAWVHASTKRESPTWSIEVRTALEGARRRLGTRPAQKRPIDLALLARMVGTLPPSPSGLRDRALLLLGLFAARRRSELVELRASDIEWRPEGIVVTVRHSKTDQTGEGFKVPVAARPGEPICPVAALRELIEHVPLGPEGYLFHGRDFYGRALPGHVDDKHVARVVKGCLLRLKLDPKDYAGHSLRSGFATQAARDGATMAELKAVGGWKSSDVLLGYIRAGTDDPFAGSAATVIGRPRPGFGGGPGGSKPTAPATPTERPLQLADVLSGGEDLDRLGEAIASGRVRVEAINLPPPSQVEWNTGPDPILARRALAWIEDHGAEPGVIGEDPAASDGSIVALIGLRSASEVLEHLDEGRTVLVARTSLFGVVFTAGETE